MNINIEFTPAPPVAKPVPSITPPASPIYDYVDKQILLDDQGRVYRYSEQLGVPIPLPPGTVYQNGQLLAPIESCMDEEKRR